MSIIGVFLVNNFQSKGIGGLFDFNATLSLIAMEFVFLTFFLNLTFYKPISSLFQAQAIFTNLQANVYKNYALEEYKMTLDAYNAILHSNNKSKFLVLKTKQQIIKQAERDFDDFLKQMNLVSYRVIHSVQKKKRRLISINDSTLRRPLKMRIEKIKHLILNVF